MNRLYSTFLTTICALLPAISHAEFIASDEKPNILRTQCADAVEKYANDVHPAQKLKIIGVGMMAITGSKFACLVKARDLSVPDGKPDRESIVLYTVAADVQSKAGAVTPVSYVTP